MHLIRLYGPLVLQGVHLPGAARQAAVRRLKRKRPQMNSFWGREPPTRGFTSRRRGAASPEADE